MEEFASAGADNITIHVEATPHVHYTLAGDPRRRVHRRRRDLPGDPGRRRSARCGGLARPGAVHERQPGLGRADVHPRVAGQARADAGGAPRAAWRSRSTAASTSGPRARPSRPAPTCWWPARPCSGPGDPAAAYTELVDAAGLIRDPAASRSAARRRGARRMRWVHPGQRASPRSVREVDLHRARGWKQQVQSAGQAHPVVGCSDRVPGQREGPVRRLRVVAADAATRQAATSLHAAGTPSVGRGGDRRRAERRLRSQQPGAGDRALARPGDPDDQHSGVRGGGERASRPRSARRSRTSPASRRGRVPAPSGCAHGAELPGAGRLGARRVGAGPQRAAPVDRRHSSPHSTSVAREVADLDAGHLVADRRRGDEHHEQRRRDEPADAAPAVPGRAPAPPG